MRRPVRAMVAPDSAIQAGLEKHYQAKRRRRLLDVKTLDSAIAPLPSAVNLRASLPHATEAPAYKMFEDVSDAVDSVAGYLDEEPVIKQAPREHRASAPPPKPRISVADLVSQLGAASKDEMVLDAAMRFVAQDAQRVAVLLLRKGALDGWRGVNVDGAALQRLKVPLTDVPLIGQTLTSGEPFVGELTAASLRAIAGSLGLTRSVLGIVLPLRIGQRPSGCIIGAESTLDALRRQGEYAKAAQKIDHALHISYLRRQLAAP
jgi:hypothetical protein